MHDALTENEFHSEQPPPPEDTPYNFETAPTEESPALPGTLKVKKIKIKGEKHKKPKNRLKEKRSSAKALAAAFPMVALIDEQVRTSIPEELVARVKQAKSKKLIISSTYPYATQMKESDYLEEVELLQIELG